MKQTTIFVTIERPDGSSLIVNGPLGIFRELLATLASPATDPQPAALAARDVQS